MSPDKVRRSKLNTLTDLPNVGKAVVAVYGTAKSVFSR